MKSDGIYGLVLAGGRSNRMGRDKGLIDYHGKPQRVHLFDLLNKFCAKVFVSCKKEQETPLHLNPIHDKFDFESPLNGILSAFDLHPKKAWLAVAVDMPFVDENALKFLISNQDPKKMATCFYDSEGKLPEPVFTIWEPLALNHLLRFRETGEISPRDFLSKNDVHLINIPDSRVLFNANTPDDLFFVQK